MLTRKQHELLMFIHERLADDGVSPSFDEMKDALGLKSKSGVHRLVKALEERGFIRRLAHRARALEVLRLPGAGFDAPPSAPGPGPTPSARAPAGGFSPSVIEGGGGRGRGRGVAMIPTATAASVAVPIVGRIAAGVPMEALQETSRTIDAPASMLSGGEHFALEVRGDSMIDAGILEGDIVIIRKTDQAENGAIVVALVDDFEATLKRLRRKGASIALEPANPNYETRIFGPNRIRVQGRLVGLIRNY